MCKYIAISNKSILIFNQRNLARDTGCVDASDIYHSASNYLVSRITYRLNSLKIQVDNILIYTGM